MFRSTFIRIPVSLQLFKKTVNVNSKQYHIINSFLSTQTHSPMRLPYRWYSISKPANLENVIVDYNYVEKATYDQNILIVDVREPDEVKEHGKIPNSVNIPLGNVASVFSVMSDKEFQKTYNKPKPSEDTEIIFYCMIGKRSGMAQQNVINLGYKNAKNYLGSWTEWAIKKQ